MTEPAGRRPNDRNVFAASWRQLGKREVGGLLALLALLVGAFSAYYQYKGVVSAGPRPAVSSSTDPGDGWSGPPTTGRPAVTPTRVSTADNRDVPLTDIPPMGGAHSVQRPPGSVGVLTLACASGGDGDRYRAVQYELFRGYTRFAATVSRSGARRPEARAQVEIVVDRVVRHSAFLKPGDEEEVEASVTGAEVLEIRLTCEEPAGVVTLADSRLAR